MHRDRLTDAPSSRRSTSMARSATAAASSSGCAPCAGRAPRTSPPLASPSRSPSARYGAVPGPTTPRSACSAPARGRVASTTCARSRATFATSHFERHAPRRGDRAAGLAPRARPRRRRRLGVALALRGRGRRALGVTGALGTRLAVDARGRLAGSYLGRNCRGTGEAATPERVDRARATRRGGDPLRLRQLARRPADAARAPRFPSTPAGSGPSGRFVTSRGWRRPSCRDYS